MAVFAVIRRRTEAWDRSRGLEEQEGWGEHADFMDALEADGFARLAGPLEDSEQVLIVVRADSPDQVEMRLAADPWSRMGLLETVRIAPWKLRLGTVG